MLPLSTCTVLLGAWPQSPALFFSLENCLDGDWPLFPPIPPRGLVDELLKAGSVHVALLGVFLSLGGIMMFTTKAFVWFRV